MGCDCQLIIKENDDDDDDNIMLTSESFLVTVTPVSPMYIFLVSQQSVT